MTAICRSLYRLEVGLNYFFTKNDLENGRIDGQAWLSDSLSHRQGCLNVAEAITETRFESPGPCR
jgi:hypothetical protein